jgi:hypothetical protein
MAKCQGRQRGRATVGIRRQYRSRAGHGGIWADRLRRTPDREHVGIGGEGRGLSCKEALIQTEPVSQACIEVKLESVRRPPGLIAECPRPGCHYRPHVGLLPCESCGLSSSLL